MVDTLVNNDSFREALSLFRGASVGVQTSPVTGAFNQQANPIIVATCNLTLKEDGNVLLIGSTSGTPLSRLGRPWGTYFQIDGDSSKVAYRGFPAKDSNVVFTNVWMGPLLAGDHTFNLRWWGLSENIGVGYDTPSRLIAVAV